MKLIVILLIGLCVQANAQGDRWRVIVNTGKEIIDYDQSSLRQIDSTGYRAWIRHTPVPDSLTSARLRLCKAYSDNKFMAYSHTLYQAEFDCKDIRTRFLSQSLRNDEGDVLHSDSTPLEWKYTPPETIGEFVLNVICRAGAKK